MATISGKKFFGGTVPPPKAPETQLAAPSISDNIWSSIGTAAKNVTDSVGQDLYDRSNKVTEIQNRKEKTMLGPIDLTGAKKGLDIFGQGAGLAANAIEKTAEQVPGVKQAGEVVGHGINWLATSEFSPIKHLGDIIGENKTLQEAVRLYDTDASFKDTIDAVANTARLGGDVGAIVDGAVYAKNVTDKIVSNVKSSASMPSIPNISGKAAVSSAKNVVRDVMPTSERFVNTEVTKALDLTQGDVKNISLSTGNEVGQFMAKKNLIGSNVGETNKLIDDFYKKNYADVRTEIGKVKKIYDKNELPAFKEALTELKKKIEDVPGLTEANGEVDSLLGKNKFTLDDVQKAKELMDEHFSLYKMTGDVKEGVAKQGLSNLRKELREFIETKVKKETGADIRELNNNVQTSRSIQDAIETRSTRGTTRATLTAGDIVTFLTGAAAAGPAGGLAAIVLKKIYQSPSFKLKLSKYLDGLSDAKKAKIEAEFQQGKVPKEIEKLQSSSESTMSNTNPSTDNAPSPNLPKSDIPASMPQPGQKASLLDKARQTGSFIKDNIGNQRGFVKVPGKKPTATIPGAQTYAKEAKAFVKNIVPNDVEQAINHFYDVSFRGKEIPGGETKAQFYSGVRKVLKEEGGIADVYDWSDNKLNRFIEAVKMEMSKKKK